jgi:hypothetical protein
MECLGELIDIALVIQNNNTAFVIVFIAWEIIKGSFMLYGQFICIFSFNSSQSVTKGKEWVG